MGICSSKSEPDDSNYQVDYSHPYYEAAASCGHNLYNKHVLVIGGCEGIGRVVATLALTFGARVTVSGNDQRSLDAAVADFKLNTSSSVQGLLCDVDHLEYLEANLWDLFDRSLAGAGCIHHVVVASADYCPCIPLAEVTPATTFTNVPMAIPILIAKVAARYLPHNAESSLTFTTSGSSQVATVGWAPSRRLWMAGCGP